jgi:uncharacterized protein (TIGR02118 family)
MIKSISLAHRRAGLTREEFNKYWKEQHGPLAARMFPGLRRYVQNHFVQVPGYQSEGDGIVEMWWDDVEAFQKSMEFLRTEAGKPLAADGAKFSEMRSGGLWIVEEHIIKDELSK